jgi:hypothetical protein
MARPRLSEPYHLWLYAGLLLLFWLTRIIAIDAFPPFIDEGLHIYFGEQVLATGPLAYASDGRQFTVWWLMLFQSSANASIWIARVAILLASLPGFAAVVSTGRIAAGIWGGSIAGLLYILSSYHYFIGRMALADPAAGSAVLVALYFSYRLSRRIRFRDAASAGLALFIGVGAKSITIPYLGIPVAAVLTVSVSRWDWRVKLRWLLVALVISGGLIIGYFLLLNWRGYNPYMIFFARNSPLTSTNLLATINTNAVATIDVLSHYFGGVPFLLFVGSVVVLIVRRRYFLPLCLLPPLLVTWSSGFQSTRHWYVGATILLLCGAIVLAQSLRQRRKLVQGVGIGLVFLWGWVMWLPFVYDVNYDPAQTPRLHRRDYSEYVISDASGFGLAEAYHNLVAHDAKQIIGLLSNCQNLRYMAAPSIPVICPRIRLNREDIDLLTRLMENNRFEGSFVVLEDNPNVPSSAPGQIVATMGRPGGCRFCSASCQE